MPEKRGDPHFHQTRLDGHILQSYIKPLKPKVVEKGRGKQFLDARTNFSRNRKIIKTLLDLGFRRGDAINYKDLEYVIGVVRGSDPRTVRRCLKELVDYEFLEPVNTNRVLDKKVVSIRTKTHVHIKEYSTVKGYTFYKFGSRAPLSFQATLNSPRNPPL